MAKNTSPAEPDIEIQVEEPSSNVDSADRSNPQPARIDEKLRCTGIASFATFTLRLKKAERCEVAVLRREPKNFLVELRAYPIVGDPEDCLRHRQLMQPLMRYEVPSLFVMCFSDIALAGPHMFAIRGDRYIKETTRGSKSFRDKRIFKREDDDTLQIKPNARYIAIDQRAIAIGVNAADGYFHWMTEAIPRLLAMRQLDGFKNLPVLMRPLTVPFQQESLDLLKEKPRFVEEDVIRVTRAYVPSYLIHTRRHGRYSPELIELLRKFRDEYLPATNNQQPRKFYISRKDAAKRRIVNNDEVETAMEALGYTCLTLTGIPFSQQIELFSGAESIVAQHGGGLTGLMFCQSGTRVVELYAKHFEAPSPFWVLASLAQLDYSLFLCAPKLRGKLETKDDDIYVDVEALKRHLLLDASS